MEVMMEVYAKKKHYLDYQAKGKVFQMVEQRNSWTQNRTSKEDFQTQCFQQACQFKSDNCIICMKATSTTSVMLSIYLPETTLECLN